MWQNVSMSALNWIVQKVAELRSEGLFREVDDGGLRRGVEAAARALGVPFVDASSNDYLGMASWTFQEDSADDAMLRGAEPEGTANVPRETLEPAAGLRGAGAKANLPGSAASRLLGGTRDAHVELERELAEWVRQQDSLLFSSGYSANVGLVSALAGPGDIVFSDSLNHASIVDGCRLSRAKTVVFPHMDVGELASLMRREGSGGRHFVITESYFSMDGDSPDLGAMRRLCDEVGAALIVDEAHALGIFGKRGAGLAAEQGVSPDIVVGTLGKAVGLHGAFVASSREVKEWLWNRARSFVYSTAMAPLLADRLLFHVKHVQEADHLRSVLARRVTEARQVIRDRGISSPAACHGPIVPILCGSTSAAVELSDSLRSNGVLAYPVRPPTVPPGTSRIRLTISAGTSEIAFAHLLRCLDQSLSST